MNDENSLRDLLGQIREGRLGIEEGIGMLKDLPYLDIGHTKIDLHRPLRNGFPEVIYAEGKTAEQVMEIFMRIAEHSNVLATRVSGETAELVLHHFPEAEYNSLGRCLFYKTNEIIYRRGEIGIITAGTSDLGVAEEARVTCEMMGSRATIISDVGVAGIHRLFDRLEQIRKSTALIVIAGMEGALSSVVGGLVDLPIIAVPTSVGYGANFSGLSALLGMLTSCASGVTVVNIDNGFGAACAACKINNIVQ